MVRNNQVLSTKNIDTQFTKTNQNITLDSVINIMKIGNDKQTKIKIFPSLIQKIAKLVKDHKEGNQAYYLLSILMIEHITKKSRVGFDFITPRLCFTLRPGSVRNHKYFELTN